MTSLPRRTVRRRLPLLAAVLLGALAPLPTAATPAALGDSSTKLVGLFRLTPGKCSGGGVTGTYLRMILPSGSVNGPYMSNADSPCGDQSYTPLGPGTDGGLSTVGYQPPPDPSFDSSGNARAGRITARAQYYGTAFATATSPVDPQTRTSVAVPTVTLTGRTLTANLKAFSVSWNKQYFNQGAPKPDGSTPGSTRVATGTYDPSTRHFTLDWASQVQGGPFDKFTGKWHFEGVFVPASPGSADTGTAGATTPRSKGSSSSSSVPAGAQSQVEAPSVGAAPAAGDTPPTAPGATSPQTVAATTEPVARTVTHRSREWKVSAPLAALTIALAIVAVGLIIGTWRLERRAGTGRRAA